MTENTQRPKPGKNPDLKATGFFPSPDVEPADRKNQDYPELDEQGRWKLPKEESDVEEST